jgi:Raf kinase inhibitor-like YbhB/YbcL family protein
VVVLFPLLVWDRGGRASRHRGAWLRIAVGAALAATCAQPNTSSGGEAMKLGSTEFVHQGEIPERYTCEGEDIAPMLAWSELPAGTRSLALIVDDPDAPDPAAPKLTWVHWVLYGLPPTAAGLPEAGRPLPAGTLEGVNDWKRTGYGGPCPPIGRHRYFFKLYALDAVLPDLQRPTKAQLEKAMDGHVLAKAELIGTYQKRRR